MRGAAQRVADALPPRVVEVVLTGSVSRGMADELSDTELLLVTEEQLDLEQCYALARRARLEGLDTWGARDPVTRRVSGRFEGVPFELIWWPRAFAETRIEALLAGETPSTADALAHGIALRSAGLLEAWQRRLADYPPELARARIEEAAVPWGGFHAEGVLTLLRPGDRLALMEWIVDGAVRVLTIVFALNRVWQPGTKRVTQRVEELALKPERLAQRIDAALAELDPRVALLLMTELQLEAVSLAASGPYVDRARPWLSAAAEILRRA